MSRRQLMVSFGRGTLAIAVLGVAACSGGGSSGSAAPPTTGTSPGTASQSAGAASDGAANADAGGGVDWKRVDLGFVSAYVLVRGSQAAVVDTGVSGSADAIGQVLDAAGPGWAGVRHVILTHNHPDHAGSVADVLTRATSATGYIGEADRASVASPRPLRTIADGADVFGLQIVATPGHTPGHMSMFDPGSGLLVAGDALNNADTGITGANPQFSADMTTAARSVAKLAALPVRTILFGHGAPLTAEAATALTKLAAG